MVSPLQKGLKLVVNQLTKCLCHIFIYNDPETLASQYDILLIII